MTLLGYACYTCATFTGTLIRTVVQADKMEIGLNILVDTAVLGILIFGFHLARKEQLYPGLFSLFGIVLTTILTLHYYVRLSDIITKQFLIPEDISQISVYGILVVLLGFVLSAGFESLAVIFKLEAHPWIDKWGGFLVGLIKIYLVIGLIVLGLHVSHQKILVRSVYYSFSQAILGHVSTGLYTFSFDHILVKVFPNAKFNKEVIEVSQSDK